MRMFWKNWFRHPPDTPFVALSIGIAIFQSIHSLWWCIERSEDDMKPAAPHRKKLTNTRNETVAFGALIFTCTFFCFFSFHLRLGIVASSLVAFCIDATCSSVLLVRRTEHCEAGEKRVCNHYGFSLLIRQFSYQQRYKVWMINC